MTKDEAPIKGEGMISDPDEYDWKCGCALCEVRYKNWKSDYDVQQAALRNEALDKKAENARELGLDYEPDYKVTVVDDQHPKGVPLEQWGRPAPVQDSTCSETLRAQGKAYPRTCRKCGLGPCIGAPKQARSAPVQEPVKFLANGTRFKTSEFPYGVCINGLPKELSGRWVALVAAEDNCHLKLTTPPAAKRQWVGLTPEDYKDIFKAQTCERVVQLAEAILKEKNT